MVGGTEHRARDASIATASEAVGIAAARGLGETEAEETLGTGAPRRAEVGVEGGVDDGVEGGVEGGVKGGASAACVSEAFVSDRGRAQYLADIARIFELLTAGETYEVCLTTHFRRYIYIYIYTHTYIYIYIYIYIYTYI